MAKAKEAARKALELDDTLAEAHTSLAGVKEWYDWDFAGAEKEYRRAIELDPNYVSAHEHYSIYLCYMERFDEGIREAKRAQELDPVSLVINRALGSVYYYARQYDRAIEQYKRTLDLDPNFRLAHHGLASCYERKGMYDDAVAEYLEYEAFSRTSEELAGGGSQKLVALRRDYELSGMKGFWNRQLDLMFERSKKGYVPGYAVARIYATLGEKDRALEWLEKAYAERAVLVHLNVWPEWDILRPDPRFVNLVRRVGLAPQ